jgi:hypothetical protein
MLVSRHKTNESFAPSRITTTNYGRPLELSWSIRSCGRLLSAFNRLVVKQRRNGAVLSYSLGIMLGSCPHKRPRMLCISELKQERAVFGLSRESNRNGIKNDPTGSR